MIEQRKYSIYSEKFVLHVIVRLIKVCYVQIYIRKVYLIFFRDFLVLYYLDELTHFSWAIGTSFRMQNTLCLWADVWASVAREI